jgi:hypothetical protein
LDSDLWPSSVVKPSGRYTLTAQALHWITAALMFVALPVAWVMVNMPETAARRSLLFTLHKSIGLTIVMIVVLRLAWRAKHPPPPLGVRLNSWEKGTAIVSHWMTRWGTGAHATRAGGKRLSFQHAQDEHGVPSMTLRNFRWGWPASHRIAQRVGGECPNDTHRRDTPNRPVMCRRSPSLHRHPAANCGNRDPQQRIRGVLRGLGRIGDTGDIGQRPRNKDHASTCQDRRESGPSDAGPTGQTIPVSFTARPPAR